MGAQRGFLFTCDKSGVTEFVVEKRDDPNRVIPKGWAVSREVVNPGDPPEDHVVETLYYSPTEWSKKA